MVDTRRNSHPALRSGPEKSSGSNSHGGSGTGGTEKGKDKSSDVTTINNAYVFTARTCLELLPLMNPTQIDVEIKHLRILDRSVHEKLKGKCNTDTKRDLLHKSLSDSLITQIDTVVAKYDTLLESIYRKVEHTERKIDEAHTVLAERMEEAQRQVDVILETPITPLTPPTPQADSSELDEHSQEEPVRFIDVDLPDLSFHDVLDSFDLNKTLPGNRTSTYFGADAYSYGHRGRISHEPAQYPADHPVLTPIFTSIQQHDPEFTPELYTCLVAHYPNGQSSLGMHQDNESVIAPGSNIYTVSFGATRTLRLFNTTGPLQEQHHKLENRSVHVMTRESQSSWKHGIIREPDVTEGRISLTFRRLIQPDTVSTAAITVPPIAPPQQPERPVRVLLLTDSIHLSTPDYLFEAIPNHVCIKQVEFQLENFDRWSSQFSYTDYVILSSGINDLSRYGHTAKTLADIVIPKLKFFCNKFPQTKFIFNSVLLTRDYGWCNDEVKCLNTILHNVSRQTENLYFFDSDGIMASRIPYMRNKSFYEEGRKTSLSDGSMRDARSNNGVHITLEMRRLIISELVKGVGFMSGCRSDRFRSCNWMYNVTPRRSF